MPTNTLITWYGKRYGMDMEEKVVHFFSYFGFFLLLFFSVEFYWLELVCWLCKFCDFLHDKLYINISTNKAYCNSMETANFLCLTEDSFFFFGFSWIQTFLERLKWSQNLTVGTRREFAGVGQWSFKSRFLFFVFVIFSIVDVTSYCYSIFGDLEYLP